MKDWQVRILFIFPKMPLFKRVRKGRQGIQQIFDLKHQQLRAMYDTMTHSSWQNRNKKVVNVRIPTCSAHRRKAFFGTPSGNFSELALVDNASDNCSIAKAPLLTSTSLLVSQASFTFLKQKMQIQVMFRVKSTLNCAVTSKCLCQSREPWEERE